MGKRKVSSMVYYELMGIESDATPEQIKKAYRRKALQLHPDKRGNTPESQEEFTRMKQAYDVLSDPQKREVYDQVGEDGIKLMEDYGNMSPEEMSTLLFRSMGAFGAKGKCVLILLVSLLFAFFLLIPIFWCLRADSSISWNWAVVCIPLWIVDGIYYCCLGCMYASSDAGMDPEEKSHEKPPLYKLYAFLKALLLLVLQIFLALKLNGDLTWSLAEVLVPYFVYDGLNLLEGLAAGVLGYKMFTKDSEGAGVTHTEDIKKQRAALVLAVARKLTLNLARITQGVLLALKVDDNLGDASWWLVFIPVWLYVAYFVSFPVRKYFRAKAKANAPKKSPRQQHTHDAYTRESVTEEEEEAVSKFPLLDAMCTILVICALMSPFFILSARLQDGSFSSIYVLLPWLIVVGLVFCFICCAISCVSFNVPEEGVPEQGEQDASENVRNTPSAEEVV
ncbi:DnaJ-like protein subfamily B member 4 [Phytophthora ramorum]|uniref:DnaJ-like protein subfamily B member 4 n=1 Tax=Phytophthora ramorum TaxID=164328 RepID=UPI0030AD16CB|nr:DnaJ-like protein subfamily B member 4 [Phytophthora ramorum]